MTGMKTKLFVLLIFLQLAASAQEIIIPVFRGARNAAMGDALVSESGDVSTVVLNPASLYFLKSPSIFFNHGQLNNNLGMTENFAAPILQLSVLSLAVGLESYHFGYLGKNQNYPGQQIFEFGYNISAATSLFESKFSIGGTVAFRHAQTDVSKAWVGNLSIGINYSPTPDINYGLALNNIGDDIRYFSEDTSMTAKNIKGRKRLVLGASMRYPTSASLRRTVFVLALANEKIFGTAGLLYKAGIEVIPWKYLNLRIGYVLGPDISEPRLGAGINFNAFILEYVYYGGPSPTMRQQFSVSIML